MKGAPEPLWRMKHCNEDYAVQERRMEMWTDSCPRKTVELPLPAGKAGKFAVEIAVPYGTIEKEVKELSAKEDGVAPPLRGVDAPDVRLPLAMSALFENYREEGGDEFGKDFYELQPSGQVEAILRWDQRKVAEESSSDVGGELLAFQFNQAVDALKPHAQSQGQGRRRDR